MTLPTFPAPIQITAASGISYMEISLQQALVCAVFLHISSMHSRTKNELVHYELPTALRISPFFGV